LALTLQRNLRASLESHRIRAEQVPRLLGEKDRVPGLAGGGLDPGGDVDGVADHAELEAPASADVPREHCARIEANADLKRAGEALSGRSLDRPCGGEGLVGVVRLPPWRPAGAARHRRR
jgi:hypothetical protein